MPQLVASTTAAVIGALDRTSSQSAGEARERRRNEGIDVRRALRRIRLRRRRLPRCPCRADAAHCQLTTWACWSLSADRSLGWAATASSCCSPARWRRRISRVSLRLPRHGRQRGRRAHVRAHPHRHPRRPGRLQSECRHCNASCSGACATARVPRGWMGQPIPGWPESSRSTRGRDRRRARRRTRLKHYYLQRLLSPEFWRKVLSGRFSLRQRAGELAGRGPERRPARELQAARSSTCKGWRMVGDDSLRRSS